MRLFKVRPKKWWSLREWKKARVMARFMDYYLLEFGDLPKNWRTYVWLDKAKEVKKK